MSRLLLQTLLATRRASVLVGGALLLLGGCRSEAGFVEQFVELDCEYAMVCYDEAVLNFYGWDDVETCITDHGPAVLSTFDGCIYERSANRPCLQAMRERSCPDEGEEHEWPAECDEVFVECDDG